MPLPADKTVPLTAFTVDFFESDIDFLNLGIGSWLRKRALATPDAIAFRYLKKNGSSVSEHRFGEIDLEARWLAAWLLRKGRPGDRVLLAHAPGPEFVAAFFACQYAGFIAVPAFPPRRTRHGNRVTGILRDAGCKLALADAIGRAALEAARRDEADWAGVSWPGPEDLTIAPLEAGELHRPAADDVAFLQYTSGSTGTPKGVMVTHRNVKHNVGLQRTASGFEAGSLMVSWVPFFHDFGLVHGLLCPIAGGGSAVYLPPNDFMQSPELWLRTISAYRASHSCAPNFAYDLCVRSVGEELKKGLDLSAWRYCVNGSEPIQASGVRGFVEAFAPYGARPNLVQPAYGLAENTLYVSSGYPDETLAEFKEERSGADQRSLVVCGRVPGQTVVIVDPFSGRPCQSGHIGEIWIQGDSVAKGYWNKPVETEETFGGRLAEIPGSFLRTGDLGFKHGDRLVVSGRLKDLIIVRGGKHYPQDLEATAREASPELAACAAFSVDGPEGEQLVLVQETTRHPKTPLADLAEAIARAISQEHGVQLSGLLLVPIHSVPRTSSGKIQRRACRAAYLEGSFKAGLRWPLSDAPIAPAPSQPTTGPAMERLFWVRAKALELGALVPELGSESTLDSWSMDSLKIAELCARYQREFGEDLGALAEPERSLRNLLGLEEAVPAQAGDRTSAVSSAPRRWRCPVALESLWAFHQSAPDSNAYHMAWTVQVSGRPDPEQVRAGLLSLAQSQIALRSGFELDEHSILWQVESEALASLEQPWADEGSLSEAERWADAWNRKPFDPACPPLWRAAFLPLEGGACLLAFVFHHLIFDQRSLDVFHQSLDKWMGDPGAKAQIHAEPPARVDDAGAAEDTRKYWQGLLKGLAREPWLDAGLLGVLQAPGILNAEVPKGIVDALRRLAVSEHSTLFSVIALAWAEALADLSGLEDACFMVPFTQRDLPLSDSRIGYGVHPLPVRLRRTEGFAVRERLAEATRRLRDAAAHRHLSLAEAMRCVGLSAPTSALSFRYLSEDRANAATCMGFPAGMRQLRPSACKMALSLEVSGEESWALSLEYHPLALPEAKAKRCLQVFLGACRTYASQAPGASFSRLKRGSLPPSEHSTVLEAFHAHVLLDSDAIAVVSDKGSVNYGTLSAQVRSVARTLIQAGVQPGERVGICSQASEAWVAAMLGCFEAGAVYVPLDPGYPSERLKIVLEDSACRLVLSDTARPGWAGTCAWTDIEAALQASPPYLRQPGRPRPEDAAYVIFTSGSSGRPKGVQVSHAALMNNARTVGLRPGLTARDRVMQFCSISFDVSLEEVFPALAAGACVALLQRKGAPGPAEMASFIRRHGVSQFLLPTAYWHVFMQAGGADQLKDCPSLRCLTVGGEAPAPRLVQEWNRVLPQVALYNGYGPTEACIFVTFFECKPGETTDAPVPLGEPLHGVELVVVGQDGRMLPAGESGELWISGECLADGYLSPGGLDRARFAQASPDGGAPRAFYRTGDRSVMDGLGRIVYQGRMDRQIKVAGVRMDLEEIEILLARAEGVSEAVVAAEGSEDDLKLRAWVAARPGQSPSPQFLKEWLKKSLPQACMPSDICVLKAFPVGPGGKIDRKALKSLPVGAALSPAESSPAPARIQSHELDRVGALCAAFSTVLNRAVGPEEDFFSLGGTSLKAVRLAGEAGRRLERTVQVDQIYQASTPRSLAALLEGPRRASDRGVLRLLSQGPGPAWVLLPPSSGRLASYRGLAGLLDGRAQVWGLDLSQLPAPEAGGWKAWVEACANALEAGLPAGELVLGGWSMGGLLAADMARILTQRGRVVRRLILIDALVPDPLKSALALMDPSVLETVIDRDLGAEALAGGGEPGGGEERRRYHLHVAATSGFTLMPLPVPVSLVLSEHTSREEPRSSWMSWSLMARSGMTCQLVLGDHFSVLAPGNLKRIAEYLVTDMGVVAAEGLVRA